MQLKKNKNLLWTKAGLTKLGKIIRASRERQSLALVEAVALIERRTGLSVGFRTLASVETAITEPKFNTLAAIAAAGFVEKDGYVLNIYDFIIIASEADEEKPVIEHPLGKLIESCLQENNYDLEQFSEITDVSPSDLEIIMQGGITATHRINLRLICGHLRNPTTGRLIGSLEELCEYCGLDEKYRLTHSAKSILGSRP